MSGAILSQLMRGELALTVGILLVLALRRPVRNSLGPLAGYLLWLVVPASVFASLLPAPAPTGAMAPVVSLVADAAWQAKPVIRKARHASDLLLALWAIGAVAAMAVFALRQARFVKGLGHLKPSPADPALLLGQHTGAGPLLLGALRPRIVAPADFEARFQGPARDLVLAHERVHLARGDAAVNALVVIVRCFAWFNPLAHIAARALRVDQEIACDAAVVERHPHACRLYAQTLLGTSLTPFSAPFGCHWPAVGLHPLKERLMMLNTTSTPPARKTLGALLVGTLALAAAGAVWAANAPEPQTIRAPVWLQKPTGEDMASAYPAEAIKAGVDKATVVMDCGIADDGRLTRCLVTLEKPTQYGFGAAVIKLSQNFQMAAKDMDGHPTAGGMVRIPMVFCHGEDSCQTPNASPR